MVGEAEEKSRLKRALSRGPPERQRYDNLFRGCKFFLHDSPCNPSCFVKLVQAPCAAADNVYVIPPPLSLSVDPIVPFGFLFRTRPTSRANIAIRTKHTSRIRETIAAIRTNCPAISVNISVLLLDDRPRDKCTIDSFSARMKIGKKKKKKSRDYILYVTLFSITD